MVPVVGVPFDVSAGDGLGLVAAFFPARAPMKRSQRLRTACCGCCRRLLCWPRALISRRRTPGFSMAQSRRRASAPESLGALLVAEASTRPSGWRCRPVVMPLQVRVQPMGRPLKRRCRPSAPWALPGTGAARSASAGFCTTGMPHRTGVGHGTPSVLGWSALFGPGEMVRRCFCPRRARIRMGGNPRQSSATSSRWWIPAR